VRRVCVWVVAHAADMFAINSSSGELFVSGVVDRERPSLVATKGVLQITVKVSPTTHAQRH